MHIRVPERIAQALRHARFGIWTVAVAYILSVLAGMAMVHSGNHYALTYRDNLIHKAETESTTLRQYYHGNRLTAAGLDAGGNAAAGFLSLLAGYGVVSGYWVAATRGWVGGVVSVNDKHASRLAQSYSAFYYVTTLLLQLLPYSLAGGAGVNLGISAFANESRTGYHGPRVAWLRIPREAISDAVWIYLLALPLFVLASLFEFTM